MNSDGKWGGSLGNGKGLIVTEQDAHERVTFAMHPELYHDSYVPTQLRGAEAIHDEFMGETRYTSFVDERRGLVALIARPS
jgi:hypothetical protein